MSENSIESILQASRVILKGHDSPDSIEAIEGGGNNRAYKLSGGKADYFVKSYFRNPHDTRNRGAREFAFSSFLWCNALRQIPRPFGYDDSAGVGVFEFVYGSPVVSASSDRVEEAFDFFRGINALRGRAGAREIHAASEASFSMAAHIAVVDRRVANLSSIDPSDELEKRASVVANELAAEWRAVQASAMHEIAKAGLDAEAAIGPGEQCLSPSDFGFHNARERDGRLVFFDFEYAGWDDPAKVLCDFFRQPKVPARLEFFPAALGAVSRALGAAEEPLRRKIGILFPIYGIKWCCILLNDFSIAGGMRRAFAGHLDAQARKSAQLEKAEALLANIRRKEAPFNGMM